MPRIVHPEWRDYHETTKYPFADSATLANADGDFIGESLFFDALLHPIGASHRIYLSQVTITHERATLQLGDDNQDNIATATFDIVDPPDNVRFVDVYGRPAGILVSSTSRLATFQSWSIGTHSFVASQTEFAARVCVPTPRTGFRGFLLEDGSFFSGDIWIVGSDGVVVSSEVASSTDVEYGTEHETYNVIRIDVVGDPLFRRRLCSNIFTAPIFLRTVTFQRGTASVVCSADEFGDVKMLVGTQDASDSVLRIRAIPDTGIVVESVGERITR